MRASAVIVIGLASAIALTGCATTKTVVKTTPGPTVTVTPTPTAIPRSADDSLTALDAWLACSAIARNDVATQMADEAASAKWASFDPKFIEAKNGGFELMVGVQFKGATYGAADKCDISGTVGSPTVTTTGFFDLG